jgi:hypothetical protein
VSYIDPYPHVFPQITKYLERFLSCQHVHYSLRTLYRVITNDVKDYITLLVAITQGDPCTSTIF